jgi:polyphosphate glucokinase
MEILGIDVGGSGIKGAPVETSSGALLAPRYRIPTPANSKPKVVADLIAEITNYFNWHGPVGCGFPSAVQDGVILTAANIHKKWVGVNAEEIISQATGCPVMVLNDADAAGLAEMTFGAGRDRKGTVIIVTIGTGLGTAFFTNGHLLPNAELGHLKINGEDAELRASDAARKREKLSWKKWARRFDIYLNTLELLFYPNLFILGGGISSQADKFLPFLTVRADVVAAQLLNEAGIVGAALAAQGVKSQ